LYDDRCLQAVQLAGKEYDVAELITFKSEHPASHVNNQSRLKPNEITENISVDFLEILEANDTIVLFDDVLTAGAHFRACKDAILAEDPTKKVIGVFVARRIPAPIDWGDIFS